MRESVHSLNNMEKIVLAVPVFIGAILVLSGIILMVYRRKSGISVTGVITDIARTERKYSRVRINLEAPVVQYTINGEIITAVSSKFFAEGIYSFKRGKPISIRVSSGNNRKFVPEERSGAAEKILITCGLMMALGCVIMIFRYCL